MYPESKDFLLLPILPHLSLPYSLVLPEKSKVSISVRTPYAATLSVDGHTNLPFASGSTVNIRQSAFKTKFLRIHPEAAFFSTLEQKLKGKRDAVSG
jgi:NAD kinase